MGTALFVLVLHSAQAQQTASHPDVSPPSAPVELDGVELFQVRGVSALPAAERAAAIGRRIEAAAANRAVGVDSVTTADSEVGTEIRAGDQRIMVVTDEDARIEGVGREP